MTSTATPDVDQRTANRPRRWLDEAVLAVGIVALLGVLVVRNELPVPATPAPPPVLAEVTTGATGAEQLDGAAFWTVVDTTATLALSNTTVDPRTVTVRFRLADGPCRSGRNVAVAGNGDGDGAAQRVRLPRGGSIDVEVADIRLDALSSRSLVLTSDGAPCDPLPTDPRRIVLQVFGLSAT